MLEQNLCKPTLYLSGSKYKAVQGTAAGFCLQTLTNRRAPREHVPHVGIQLWCTESRQLLVAARGAAHLYPSPASIEGFLPVMLRSSLLLGVSYDVLCSFYIRGKKI